MNTSPTIAAIADALAKAQAEMHNPIKDKVARVKSDKADYTYTYADLSSVLDAVRPPLARNGIALVQVPRVDNGVLTVTTRLLHGSGEWIESELADAVDPNAKIQTLGSAITYLRRYALQAICGVAAEDDDDGNAAQGSNAQTQQRRPATQPSLPAQRGNGAAPATPGATATAASPTAKPSATPAAAPVMGDANALAARTAFEGLIRAWNKPFADSVWAAAKPGDTLDRIDLLTKASGAIARIVEIMGARGEEMVHDLVNAEKPVRDLVADLAKAALGEIAATNGKGG